MQRFSTILSQGPSGSFSQNARYKPARSAPAEARKQAAKLVHNSSSVNTVPNTLVKKIIPSTVQSLWLQDVRPVQTGRLSQMAPVQKSMPISYSRRSVRMSSNVGPSGLKLV